MKLVTHAPVVLDEAEAAKLWEAALHVWARVPVRAGGCPEFREALAAFGCDVSGGHIGFPLAVREKVLARIDEARRQAGPWRPAEVSSDALQYAASGQALYICDLESDKLRGATTEDLADWSRLCDVFYPGLHRAHPTFIPQDVPTGSCDVHAFATIILNSSRPWTVSVYTAAMLPYFIELQSLCDGGMEQARRDPAFVAKCWYNSPFMITDENIQIGMKARELLGRPFAINTMPVAGIATPATLAGAIVHITAEILGCNAITLALDDRLAGYCAGPLTFDMKTCIHTQTGPDVQLLRNACAQMGGYIFGGEYRSVGGPSTAAKTPGAQSMMEKAIDTTWAICGGVRSFGSLGTLAFADVGSAVQLMLDLELMSHLERLLQGIAVDDERIAEDLICRVAPTGAQFLATEHTARFNREELWVPELMDRRVPMAWAMDPTDMVTNARDKARRLLKEAPNRCPLSREQRAEVARIVAAADAQVTATRR